MSLGIWPNSLNMRYFSLSFLSINAIESHLFSFIDALFSRRSLGDIMKRGRWATISSVKRYERHGVMQKALASSPKALFDFAKAAESMIADALLGRPCRLPRPPHS